MSAHLDIVFDDLKRHEGFRGMPYEDTTGHLTIGIGTKLPLTEAEAEMLLSMRLSDADDDARAAVLSFDGLSLQRKAVMVNMAYNLGRGGLRGFRRMREALAAWDFDKAAEEMLDSKWARQVGRRARELAEIMREG